MMKMMLFEAETFEGCLKGAMPQSWPVVAQLKLLSHKNHICANVVRFP